MKLDVADIKWIKALRPNAKIASLVKCSICTMDHQGTVMLTYILTESVRRLFVEGVDYTLT